MKPLASCVLLLIVCHRVRATMKSPFRGLWEKLTFQIGRRWAENGESTLPLREKSISPAVLDGSPVFTDWCGDRSAGIPILVTCQISRPYFDGDDSSSSTLLAPTILSMTFLGLLHMLLTLRYHMTIKVLQFTRNTLNLSYLQNHSR